MTIINTDWFKGLLEDLTAIGVQRQKEKNEITIRKVWEAGERISQAETDFKESDVAEKGMIHLIASQMGRSSTWLYKCLQTYKKWPDFETIYSLPEGESITLHKLWNIHLPSDGTPKVICGNESCKECGRRIKHNKK